MKLNGYLEYRPNLSRQELSQLKEVKNLYIRLFETDLNTFNRELTLDTNFLTIEIIQNSKQLEVVTIDKFISIYKPNRIIITINKNSNYSLIGFLNGKDLKDISIDLYWDDSESLKETLTYLLNRYSSIKHFSIYPNKEPLELEDNFLGFNRYHNNMWSIDHAKYIAFYDFKTIKDKQYIGVGKNAVSRNGYSFYKNGREIKLKKEYIDLQDHIDRLNYFINLSPRELENYPLITKEEYINSSLDIKTKHQLLISNLFNS